MQGLGLDVELHLLVVGDDVALGDLHVVEVDAGVGEPLLRRHHLGGERRHHVALGKPIEVAQLARIRRLQLPVATAIVGVFGEGGIQGALLGEQPLGIAVVELFVMALQLAQIAALLLQLALEHRQIELHQQLPALHPLPHPRVHLLHLAAGAGVEDSGVLGVDEHACALHFGGHRPEQGPEHHRPAHPSQADAHLVVIAEPLPALPQLTRPAPIPGLISGGRGLGHGGQLAGSTSRCQPPAGHTPSCCSRRSACAADSGAAASRCANSGANTGT